MNSEENGTRLEKGIVYGAVNTGDLVRVLWNCFITFNFQCITIVVLQKKKIVEETEERQGPQEEGNAVKMMLDATKETQKTMRSYETEGFCPMGYTLAS